MSHMEGPHGDSEDDADLIDSKNEYDIDDDLVYEQNVIGDIEIGVKGGVFEEAEDFENEKLIDLERYNLRGNYGGQLLSSVALDANHCIYNVAYTVVQKENNVLWQWFIAHLGEDLDIDNDSDWTFMIDRQNGLQNVLDRLFSELEHRFCV
ncbi:SWIM-type domain-containing protein [Abeliophyllum distichum]|uniref:SWIM-type domain-containing protein n=1 Tax=Abeliophyllum distichum TaxID=126358 RepID=A0ABD1Q3T4_9LAMI